MFTGVTGFFIPHFSWIFGAISVTGAGDASTVTNGGTLQMSAAITPTNATNKAVTWSVINGTGTATISSTGLLTATGAGTVTVQATAQDGSGIFGEKNITIIDFNDPAPPAASIASTNPTALTEAVANDGSLTSGTVVVTIANGTLADPLEKADVTAANLPGGMDYTVTRDSDTQLTIEITGNATNHADANDVSNITFTIAQAKVTGATGDLTTADISIDFNDPQ